MSPNKGFSQEKFLTEEEFQAMELTAREHLPERGAIFVLLALHTGARRGELLALEQKNIGQGKRKPFVHIAHPEKGSNTREIPIEPWLYKNIKEHLPQTGPLFDVTIEAPRKWWSDYRPNTAQHKSLRAARHTFAMRLYEVAQDIRLVKYCLGHRSIHNTMIYMDFAYSQDQLIGAMSRARRGIVSKKLQKIRVPV